MEQNLHCQNIRVSRYRRCLLLQLILLVLFETLCTVTAATEAAATTTTTTATTTATTDYDVLVYGSTPSGIVAAIAASRHINIGAARNSNSKVALLSQREHIGGVCSGGLGYTDTGGCEDKVIGGIAKEFFLLNAQKYTTDATTTDDNNQPRLPWNLEPHIAKQVFIEMLDNANVTLLPYGEVESVLKDNNNNGNIIQRITVVDTQQTYTSKIFIDASYEGDLMARTSNVEYTVGRESKDVYNESGAGSQGTKMEWIIQKINPFDDDETGNLLPLLNSEPPLPMGQGDKQVQAYNFRLCVTNDTELRVPFTKPDNYNPQQWELLRRFWTIWPDSTNPHKEAQGKVPSATLGAIPSSIPGVKKFDLNNCGYNPVHTDMIGGSWDYPEANYSYRKTIWEAHVNYTKGFLWFMSSDESVPESIRTEHANTWGYCGDEWNETDHFSPQLYIREARRLVGERVFTQNDATTKIPRYNESVGMGCYGFDSHCEERYACTDPETCTDYEPPYVSLQCGCGIPSPGIYQMPIWVLFPKKEQVSNLLVPVGSSASHVAYATLRMEPQFMILGHAAGVVAALSVQTGDAVQDVDHSKVAELLLADGQILSLEDGEDDADDDDDIISRDSLLHAYSSVMQAYS